MTEKRHFDIPSDKKVRLVVIGIIIVSIIDVILFGSLVEADVAPFGRLTLPDRILLGTPLFGILWIAFAGFGRKHTRGYFFRYRYGQTLSFVLFSTACTLGTNPMFRQFDPTSYGSALAFYYGSLILMFIIWGLIVSVVAIPIILWRSKRIPVRSGLRESPSLSTDASQKSVSMAAGSRMSSPQKTTAGPETTDYQKTVSKSSIGRVAVTSDEKPPESLEDKRSNSEVLPEIENASVKPLLDCSEDDLYAIAWKEVGQDTLVEGLWARLYVENAGDEGKTKTAYLKQRVQQLTNEQDILKTKRKEEEDRLQLSPEVVEVIKELIPYGREIYEPFLDISLERRSFRLINSIQHGIYTNILEYLANGADPRHPSHLTEIEPLTFAKTHAYYTPKKRSEVIKALECAAELWDRELLDERGIHHSELSTIDFSQYK